MRKTKIAIHFAALATLALLFQNCYSEVEFSEMSSVEDALNGAASLDDVVLLPPVAAASQTVCVTGTRLGVWLDPDGTGIPADDNFLGTFVAYSGDVSARENYGYYSDSAHPVNGPAPDSYHSKVFFYEGPDGLSMNYFFNVDAGGSADNVVNWDIFTSLNEGLDEVILSDDGSETRSKGIDADGVQKYEARMHYWKNTDGAVLGPFAGEEWAIQVDVLQSGDNQNATFYSADGSVFSLKDNQDQISSFLIMNQGYEICETEVAQ